MWDWLLSPVDAARAHDVGWAVSWHARVMVVGWGILAPSAILMARFFKVMPGQNWPDQLDSKMWWHSHWMGQTVVFGLTLLGLILVWPPNWQNFGLHRMLGYGVLAGVLIQMVLGMARGSKGGPTATGAGGSLRGDHYDMTRRRRVFERVHKTFGYIVLLTAACTILVGLWEANGPRWMWLCLALWWSIYLFAFAMLQRRGMAVDTYKAIWGPDLTHPGNRRSAPK